MLRLILTVKHQHQRDDGELATGTRRQIADTTMCIGIDGGNKLLHAAALHRLTRLSIHRTGITIRRIVREIATDDKEILVRKIRLQRLCHLLQLIKIISRNNNRYDGRHVLQPPLQERQLHLQTMLPVVCLRLVTKNTIRVIR